MPHFFKKVSKKTKLLEDNCITRANARNPAPAGSFYGAAAHTPLLKKISKRTKLLQNNCIITAEICATTFVCAKNAFFIDLNSGLIIVPMPVILIDSLQIYDSDNQGLFRADEYFVKDAGALRRLPDAVPRVSSKDISTLICGVIYGNCFGKIRRDKTR
jgi:hypothetical protein